MKSSSVAASLITAVIMVTMSITDKSSAQTIVPSKASHQTYSVIVLPPDSRPDSFLAGYVTNAPLTENGVIGIAGDTSIPGNYNSYTWANGQQVRLQALPQLPDLVGTGTYINWINRWGFAAGYPVNERFGLECNAYSDVTGRHCLQTYCSGSEAQNRAVWSHSGNPRFVTECVISGLIDRHL